MAVVKDRATYTEEFDKVFARLMESGNAFSANDLREQVFAVPDSPNLVGILWQSRIRQHRGELALVGIVKSTNPASNRSIIMEYQVRKEVNQ